MNKIPDFLSIGVTGVVILLFIAAIAFAAWCSFNDVARFPPIGSYYIGAVNGILAANLGGLLGISFVQNTIFAPKNTIDVLQWISAAVYLIVLVGVIIIWAFLGFKEDSTKVVSIFPEMTKNAIGILLAIFSASLGLQRSSTNN
jgi:hypothetical protein